MSILHKTIELCDGLCRSSGGQRCNFSSAKVVTFRVGRWRLDRDFCAKLAGVQVGGTKSTTTTRVNLEIELLSLLLLLLYRAFGSRIEEQDQAFILASRAYLICALETNGFGLGMSGSSRRLASRTRQPADHSFTIHSQQHTKSDLGAASPCKRRQQVALKTDGESGRHLQFNQRLVCSLTSSRLLLQILNLSFFETFCDATYDFCMHAFFQTSYQLLARNTCYATWKFSEFNDAIQFE